MRTDAKKKMSCNVEGILHACMVVAGSSARELPKTWR